MHLRVYCISLCRIQNIVYEVREDSSDTVDLKADGICCKAQLHRAYFNSGTHLDSTCSYSANAIILVLLRNMCGGPGFYPFEILVFFYVT